CSTDLPHLPLLEGVLCRSVRRIHSDLLPTECLERLLRGGVLGGEALQCCTTGNPFVRDIVGGILPGEDAVQDVRRESRLLRDELRDGFAALVLERLHLRLVEGAERLGTLRRGLVVS